MVRRLVTLTAEMLGAVAVPLSAAAVLVVLRSAVELSTNLREVIQ